MSITVKLILYIIPVYWYTPYLLLGIGFLFTCTVQVLYIMTKLVNHCINEAYTHVSTWIHTLYTHIHHVHTHTHAHTQTHTHVRAHVPTRTCIHTHTHKHTNIHTHTHTDTHTHTHTRTNTHTPWNTQSLQQNSLQGFQPQSQISCGSKYPRNEEMIKTKE